MRKFVDWRISGVPIKEIGGWCQWRWESRHARWFIPWSHIGIYRGWKGLQQITVEFAWLGWSGQLWSKRNDTRIKHYGPLKNA
jgi:hypothetical protein